jgi:hypothetical protein
MRDLAQQWPVSVPLERQFCIRASSGDLDIAAPPLLLRKRLSPMERGKEQEQASRFAMANTNAID